MKTFIKTSYIIHYASLGRSKCHKISPTILLSCVYLCNYAHIYICVYPYFGTCVYIYIYTCTLTHTHTQYTHTFTHPHIFRIYASTHIPFTWWRADFMKPSFPISPHNCSSSHTNAHTHRLFFASFAQTWCEVDRKKSALNSVGRVYVHICICIYNFSLSLPLYTDHVDSCKSENKSIRNLPLAF